MAVTLATANAYFGPKAHLRSFIWQKFTTDQRTAALAHAVRIIWRATGTEPSDTVTTNDDQVRPDLAVCEQALFMLERSPAIADGKEAAPRFLSSQQGSPDNPRDEVDPYDIAPEARRWLTQGSGEFRAGPAPMLEIMRG